MLSFDTLYVGRNSERLSKHHRQAGEGVRLFPRADQARGRRGKLFDGDASAQVSAAAVAL